MDNALRTISYIADIGNIVVLMARRRMPRSASQDCIETTPGAPEAKKQYKMICHVFESEDVSALTFRIQKMISALLMLKKTFFRTWKYLKHTDSKEGVYSQLFLVQFEQMRWRTNTKRAIKLFSRLVFGGSCAFFLNPFSCSSVSVSYWACSLSLRRSHSFASFVVLQT